MVKFYVSCTTIDLEAARKRVSTTLRKMGHEVVSMEYYTPQGRPSLAKCREDVEKCDFYVGIFAWRYGWVPPNDNPEKFAITELEYRHAKLHGKTPLIFILDDKAAWPLPLIDRDRDKIEALRTLLSDEMDPSLFASEDDLLVKVSEALVETFGSAARPATSPLLVKRAREIKHDVALFCPASSDAEFARAVAARLAEIGLKMPPISAGLFAPNSSADFEKLEQQAREARSAVVVLSDSAVAQLPPDPLLSIVLQTLEARTGKLVAFCRGPVAVSAAARWRRAEVLDASGWQDTNPGTQSVAALTQTLGPKPASLLPMIGIPIIVVAMTATEATDLEQDPQQIQNNAGVNAFNEFTALKQAYDAMINAEAAARNAAPPPSPLVARYADERDQWKPFAGSNYTAASFIASVAQELNQKPVMLDTRLIKPQLYPFDVLLDDTHPLLPIYEGIFRNGCVVLADEFSMFHPDLRNALSALAMRKGQVALVTISPLNPRLAVPHSGLEEELRRFLKSAITRFDQCDPQSEVMVADELRLKRWLFVSLPQTLRALQSPAADAEQIERVWQSAGVAARPQITAARQTEPRIL